MTLLERCDPPSEALPVAGDLPVLSSDIPFDRLVNLAATVLNFPAAFVALAKPDGLCVKACLNLDPNLTASALAVSEQAIQTAEWKSAEGEMSLRLGERSSAVVIAVAPFALQDGLLGVIGLVDSQQRPDIDQNTLRHFFQIAAAAYGEVTSLDRAPLAGQIQQQSILHLLDQVRYAQAMFIDGRPSEEVFSTLVQALTTTTQSQHAFLGQVRQTDDRQQILTLAITPNASDTTELMFAGRTIRLADAVQTAVRNGKPFWADAVVWHDPEHPHSPGDRVKYLLVVPCFTSQKLVGVVAIADTQQKYRAAVVEELGPFLNSLASLIEASRARTLGRQAAEAIRLRDRSLSSISSAVAIADIERPNKPIIYCNTAFETITGYHADDVIGKDFQLFEGPETDSKAMCVIRSAFEEGQECEMTVRTYRRDGSWFWNHLRLSPVREASGVVRHMVAIADDVTEKLRYQRQLIEGEARKSAILRSTLDPVLTVNIAGQILDSNPAAEEALGYQNGDLINEPLKKVIVPRSVNGLQADEIRIGERTEITAVRRDGTAFPAELAVTAMLERGEPIYTAHIRDLTVWKKSLKQQRETVAFQRAILDGANYIIIATDLNGTVCTFNDAASRMLGYSLEEVLGRSNLAQFHDPVELRKRSRELTAKFGEPVPYGFETCVAASRRNQGDRDEWTYVRKDGTRFPVLLSITTLKNDSGDVSGFLAIGYDITERCIAEKEQQKFVALVENSDDFIGMSTLDGRAFYLNQAGLNLAGLDSCEKVLKNRIPNFVTRETWATIREAAMPALKRTGKWEGEGQLRHFKTGDPIDVLITLFVVRDGRTGEPLCLATVQRDITEHKKAERALLQEKDFSETLIRSSVDGILAFDQNFGITAWNPAMEQFAGLVRSDVIGRPVFELFPFLLNDDRFLGVLKGVSGIMKDSPYVLPQTGRRGYFEAYCSPLRDASGQIMGGLAVVRDTTERRRAEEAVRLSEKRYRTVVESINEVIFQLLPAGTWAFLNPAWKVITGFEIEQTLGRDWSEFVHPDDREPASRALASLLRSDAESIRNELRIVTRGGAIKWVEVFAQATPEEDGFIAGISGTLTDVTERRKNEEEMLRAKDAAEAAAKLKSEFLANMSHEIRTPINAVIGMTSILIDSPLSPEQRDYVNVIRSGGESLLTIIDEILDFSKIESGRMQFECAPFDLRDSIEQAMDLVAALASEKGLELAYLMEPSSPATIAGDVGRLRQILVNLLSNAVKFTERGNILISVTATPIEGTRHRIQFSVKDTGIGIPSDKLERIFESFSQVDASTTRRYGGTGLGLTISKHLCELNGGTMWVESTPGVGSTFHFTIVADAVGMEIAREAATHHSPLTDRTVLVVAHDVANQLVLRQHLESWGMKPETFAAISDAHRWIAAGHKYDLVMLDADRTDVTSAVCEMFRQRTPLVLLHSVGRRKKLSEAAGAGKKRILFHAKPIKPSLLYESLQGVFAGQPIRIESPQKSQDNNLLAEQIPARILLAEDNVVNQKVATLLLSKLGYRADVANNGLEAIEALRRQPYDVVLMDMQMPEMDGLDATRRILQDGSARQKPWIIAMTANAMRSDRERCLTAGMRDFLSKPVQLADLRGAFERYGASREAPPDPTVQAEPGVFVLPDYLAEIMQAGDHSMVTELLELFRDESRSKLEGLKTALQEGDHDRAAKLAHGLKGGAAQIGALGVAQRCVELEGALRIGSGNEGRILDLMLKDFDRVEKELSALTLLS
jgi:PAS domain S-box-containing protein